MILGIFTISKNVSMGGTDFRKFGVGQFPHQLALSEWSTENLPRSNLPTTHMGTLSSLGPKPPTTSLTIYCSFSRLRRSCTAELLK